jgi:hypothetical protein
MNRATLIVLLLAALALGAPSLAADQQVQRLAEDLSTAPVSLESEFFVSVEPLKELPKYGFIYNNWVRSEQPAQEEDKGTLLNLMSGAAKLAKTPITLVTSSKEAVEKFFQFGSSEEKAPSVADYTNQPSDSGDFSMVPELEITADSSNLTFFDKEEARMMATQRTAEEATRQADGREGKKESSFGAPVIKMFILLENFGSSEK